MIDIANFHKRLTELLVNEGMKDNLKEFCRRAGINYTTLHESIKKQTLPKADIVVRLAEYFGVTTDYLYTGKLPWEEKGVIVSGHKIRERDKEDAIKDIANADDETVKRVKAILDADRAMLEARKRKEGNNDPPDEIRKVG